MEDFIDLHYQFSKLNVLMDFTDHQFLQYRLLDHLVMLEQIEDILHQLILDE